MKDSIRTGISFGLTSVVITTLGLMVGLHAGTHSKIVVLAGILTIAIADAFSDALGIRFQRKQIKHPHRPTGLGSNHCDISDEVLIRIDLCGSCTFTPSL
jgi:hypothetical protein